MGRWVYVEGVPDWENHHLATIVVKIRPGKNHRWMLNRGDFNKEKDIYMVFILVRKEGKNHSNYTLEAGAIPDQIRINITNEGQIDSVCF